MKTVVNVTDLADYDDCSKSDWSCYFGVQMMTIVKHLLKLWLSECFFEHFRMLAVALVSDFCGYLKLLRAMAAILRTRAWKILSFCVFLSNGAHNTHGQVQIQMATHKHTWPIWPVTDTNGQSQTHMANLASHRHTWPGTDTHDQSGQSQTHITNLASHRHIYDQSGQSQTYDQSGQSQTHIPSLASHRHKWQIWPVIDTHDQSGQSQAQVTNLASHRHTWPITDTCGQSHTHSQSSAHVTNLARLRHTWTKSDTHDQSL